ncbi:MAG: hypothetical protein NZ808_07800, partial [Myxococcota bacterium]|nr:hypothetical protein [Myxococcota bacterium]
KRITMSFPSEPPLDQTREKSNEGNSTQLASEKPVVLDGEVELDRDVEASSEGPTRLPVPSGPLRSQLTNTRAETKRPSLWTRIKMRSRGTAPVEGAGLGEMASRLDAIKRAVEHFDSTLETQLEAVNARLEDVWESEEQLSHLADIQDKMDQLTAAQANQTQALDGLRRTLGWLAGLIVVAAIGAVVAAGQFL